MRFTTEDGRVGEILEGGQVVFLTEQQLLEEKGIIKKKEIKAQIVKKEPPIKLEKMQKLAFDSAMRGENIFISGKAGSGKLQPYYSKIITPDGIKTMGEIKKGDFVIGRDGKPIEVLEIYPQKDLEIYKVTFKNGDTVDCCKDHLWTIQTSKLKVNKRYRTQTTLELLEQGLHKTTKSGYRFNVPPISAVEFKNKPLKIHPYLLGYLLGDGYLPETGAITLTCSYLDYEEVYNRLSSFSQYYLSKQKRQVNVERIIIRYIREDLRELGLLGHKSRTKFIPNDYIYNSIENRKFILAGLLDTDSHCQRFDSGKVKIRYSTSSENLANQVKELVLSLGGVASITKRFRKGTYEYSVPIRLPFNPYLRNYKKEIYGDYQNTEDFSRQITNIEYVGVHDGQCLLVDSEDHLYLTDNYIPTHNSTVTKEIIKELKKKKIQHVILSPTGIAASMFGEGSTIHSFINAEPSGILTADRTIQLKPFKLSLFKKVKVIIIDEISMVRADLFDYIFHQFIYNGIDPHDKQYIMVGDYNQLEPVLVSNEKPYFNYKGLDARYSDYYPTLNLKEILLDVVKRQSDPEFIEALNKIRDKQATDYFKQFEGLEKKGVILAATNKLVNYHNETELEKLEGDSYIYEGITTSNFQQKDFIVEKTITLKDGCMCMYLKNDRENGLINGDVGEFRTKIVNGKVVPYFVSKRLNMWIGLSPVDFETKEYTVIKGKVELVTKSKITQLPVKVCYSVSVHKSQSQTFEEVTVDLTDHFFGKNMLYVALSRVKSKEGLSIIPKN